MTGEIPPKEDEQTVELPREEIVRFAKALALECGSIEDHTPEGCDDWSIKDMDVDEVEVDAQHDPTLVHVRGSAEGTVSEKIRSATYNPPGKAHPAEYRNHDVRVLIDITVDFESNGGLGGAHTRVEALEDPTAPPAPDVNAHRYER